ncbi:MAG: CopG family transcriptional regulator [Candidatus Heimdallarchaeota archaeon]|nr:CopG family transcriptional regulator [Candidatus Heimdallarchaeota archaeon]
MYKETKMEKLTINLPPVEIARIDILVETGLYANRSEFIRNAIRKNLDTHKELIDRKISENIDQAEAPETKLLGGVGIFGLNKQNFEKMLAENKKLKIWVAGMLIISKDIPPELIKKTVESVKVYGIVKASSKVKKELQKLT